MGVGTICILRGQLLLAMLLIVLSIPVGVCVDKIIRKNNPGGMV